MNEETDIIGESRSVSSDCSQIVSSEKMDMGEALEKGRRYFVEPIQSMDGTSQRLP